MADGTAAPNYTIKIGTRDATELKTDFLSFVIERDMFQPDMAAIVLSNQAGQYSTIKIADEVDICVGDDAGTSIYKGEVVGLEPVYKGGEKSRILIRAMNKFHRLLRHCKSVTFTDKTDQQILNQVVGDAGLSLSWQHEKSITYKHVYQHNQTDMEFLRTRAARMGCHVWCVDKTIYVKEPNLQQGPAVTLNISEGGGSSDQPTIKSFTPRLSSASILKKVTVKGWNPETKELIVGDYSAKDSKLGDTNAVSASAELGKEETFTVDHPVWSKEEAVALAKARLVDLSLSFITGECEVTGTTKLDLGTVIGIQANTDPDTKGDDPFNGNYYVMGLTHRFVLSKTKEGGFTTILRLARDAQKKG
ncbi:MAG TPA: contractile injection system protein, VgrG/Pvc8 family [Kofleriaceae bacterium]|nr:contractile injection system protein, VgrG/Pvc8 family [Kofleriaceae bacterium]